MSSSAYRLYLFQIKMYRHPHSTVSATANCSTTARYLQSLKPKPKSLSVTSRPSSNCISEQTKTFIQDKYIQEEENVIFKAKVVFTYTPGPATSNESLFLLGREFGCDGNTSVNKYNLLGGSKNENESIIDCAARELYEESMGMFDCTKVTSALKNLPSSNIIFYTRNRKPSYSSEYFSRYSNARTTLHKTFVFFVPFQFDFLVSSVSCTSVLALEKEFAYRRSVYCKDKKLFVSLFLHGYFQPTSLDHFNEIEVLKWVSQTEMKKENINTFFYSKIQNIKLNDSSLACTSFSEYTKRSIK